MKLADKRTVGVIYAIKRNIYKDYKESIAHFMMEYSDSPRSAYSDERIERIVEHAFADILNYVKTPSFLVNEYFRCLRYPWNYSNFNAICSVLGAELQVKKLNHTTNRYEFINGFYPLDDFGFKEI